MNIVALCPLPQPLSRKRARGAILAPLPLVGEGLGRGSIMFIFARNVFMRCPLT